MKRTLFALVIAVALIAGNTFADAVLTVVHGIPGLPEPVTVTANGGELGTFDFNESLGPLDVPAGEYDVEVLLEGEPVPPLSATVTLEDSINYTAVAHLSETGDHAVAVRE